MSAVVQRLTTLLEAHEAGIHTVSTTPQLLLRLPHQTAYALHHFNAPNLPDSSALKAYDTPLLTLLYFIHSQTYDGPTMLTLRFYLLTL